MRNRLRRYGLSLTCGVLAAVFVLATLENAFDADARRVLWQAPVAALLVVATVSCVRKAGPGDGWAGRSVGRTVLAGLLLALAALGFVATAIGLAQAQWDAVLIGAAVSTALLGLGGAILPAPVPSQLPSRVRQAPLGAGHALPALPTKWQPAVRPLTAGARSATEATASGHAGHAGKLPDGPSAASVAPMAEADGVRATAIDDLWRAAKKRGFLKRPLKTGVRQIANAMALGDAVESVFMAQFSSARHAALAITQEAVLIGEWQPSPPMKAALESAPDTARVGNDVLLMRRSHIVSVQLTPDDVRFQLVDGLVVLPTPVTYRDRDFEQALLAVGQERQGPGTATPATRQAPRQRPPAPAADQAPPRMPPPLELGTKSPRSLPPLELPDGR